MASGWGLLAMAVGRVRELPRLGQPSPADALRGKHEDPVPLLLPAAAEHLTAVRARALPRGRRTSRPSRLHTLQSLQSLYSQTPMSTGHGSVLHASTAMSAPAPSKDVSWL